MSYDRQNGPRRGRVSGGLQRSPERAAGDEARVTLGLMSVGGSTSSRREVLMDEGLVISVIVVMYNSAALLPDLLESLPSGLCDLHWNLVLVDNASTDGSVEVARQLAPEATVVATGRNGGYAAGINAGVRAAPDHDAVLILNPDVRLGDGCVAELVAVLRNPGVGIAVPRIVDGEGRLSYSMRREPTLLYALADATIGALRAGRVLGLGEVVADRRQYERLQTTDWAEGSVMLVTSECMTAAAGLGRVVLPVLRGDRLRPASP